MGDRANIVFEKHSAFPHPVFLYSHWGGSEIKQTLQRALKRGKDRWKDAQYLSRIVLCEMIGKKNFEETTGTGISTAFCDGGYPLLVVHCNDSEVYELSSSEDILAPVKNKWTFEQFIAADFADYESDEE